MADEKLVMRRRPLDKVACIKSVENNYRWTIIPRPGKISFGILKDEHEIKALLATNMSVGHRKNKY